jgi:hypothetical protein
MSEMNDEDTSTPRSQPEKGITTADLDLIREYLDTPPHLRTPHDLIPDCDTAAD